MSLLLGLTFLTGFILPFGQVAAAAAPARQTKAQYVAPSTAPTVDPASMSHPLPSVATPTRHPIVNPIMPQTGGRAPLDDIPSLRTRTSRTYDLGNGEYMAKIYQRPINFRGVSGKWQPIDDTLVPTTVSGSVYHAVYGAVYKPVPGFRNAANLYTVTLPKQIQEAPVRIAVGGQWLRMTLVGAQGTGVVAAAGISYRDALPGVTVRYLADNDRVKESLVLNGLTATSHFRYHLTWSSGVYPKVAQGGQIAFVGPGGTILFTIVPPTMSDSATPRPARSAAVDMRLKGSTLTIVPDQSWLTGGHRVWPVVVDPTVVIRVPTYNVVDCTVANGASANASNCTAPDLPVGFDGTTVYRSLMYFDTSSIPSYAKVLDSDVWMFQYAVSSSTTNDITVDTIPMAQAWTTSATWNTYDGTHAWASPGGDYTENYDYALCLKCNTIPDYWIDAPLETVVQDWLNGSVPNDGVIVKSESETTVQVVDFYSSEFNGRDPHYSYEPASYWWPYLQVVYAPPTGVQPFNRFDWHRLSDRMELGVNMTTGNLVLHQSDLVVPGTGMNLSVGRWYNSRSLSSSELGRGWNLSTGFDVHLVWYWDGNTALFGPSGYQVAFQSYIDMNDGQVYSQSPPGLDAYLVRNSDGTFTMKLMRTGEVDQFTSTGPTCQFNSPPSGCAYYLTSRTDRNGNTISFAYNTNSSGTPIALSTITDTQARVTSFTYGYNSSGQLTEMVDSGSRTYQYGYSGNELTSYIDPASQVTQYAYDANGNLEQITDPDGHVTKITYDANHRATSVEFMTSATQGLTYTYSYGAGTTVMTDPNGHQTTYKYDTSGLVLEVDDAAGNVTTYAGYTADFNPEEVVDPVNQPRKAGGQPRSAYYFTYGSVPQQEPYIPWGAVLDEVQTPTGASASFQYGASNFPFFPTAYTDFQGNTVEYAYSSQGDIKSVTDGLPANNQATFVYNPNGTVSSATDFMGQETTYQYDSEGNLIGIMPPTATNGLGSIGLTVSGPLSQVTEKTVYTGTYSQKTAQIETSYSYDPLDRVIAVQYTNVSNRSTKAARYGYDADGNLMTKSWQTASISYAYDDLNRLTSETFSGPANYVLSYAYDGAGNMTSFTDTAGSTSNTTSYAYNSVNLLQTLTDNWGNQTSFAYDADGSPLSVAYPNAVTMTLGYDYAEQLTSIVGKKHGTTLSSFSYGYQNPSGAQTVLRYTQQDSAGSTAYGYDALNRLIESKTTSGGAITADYLYGYDGNGNRVSEAVSGSSVPNGSASYGYNADNELTSVNGGTLWNYNFDGNETANGTTGLGLGYDVAGQNVSVTPSGGATTNINYGGPTQVNRVSFGSTSYHQSLEGVDSQTDATGTTYYVRTPSGQLVSEAVPTSGNATGYANYYYLFDGVGSIVALTDSKGSVVNTYSYGPYGNVTAQTGTTPNPWLYASGYFDGPSELSKMSDRYYDAAVGRFTQLDPMGGGYPYAEDDPINAADRSGLWTVGV